FRVGVKVRTTDALMLASRGYAQASLKWAGPAADFAKAVAQQPDVLFLRYAHALLLLAERNRDGYRRACAEALKRFGPTHERQYAAEAARLCVLAPDAVADPARPVRLAERSVADDPTASNLYVAG